MFHLLPFAVGLLAGAAAVKLIREDKAKDGLEKVQDRLREATVNSLSAIEKSSARLRDRLDSAANSADTAGGGETAAPPAAPVAKEGSVE